MGTKRQAILFTAFLNKNTQRKYFSIVSFCFSKEKKSCSSCASARFVFLTSYIGKDFSVHFLTRCFLNFHSNSYRFLIFTWEEHVIKSRGIYNSYAILVTSKNGDHLVRIGWVKVLMTSYRICQQINY